MAVTERERFIKGLEVDIKALDLGMQELKKSVEVINKYIGKTVTKRVETALKEAKIDVHMYKDSYFGTWKVKHHSSYSSTETGRDGNAHAIYPQNYRTIDYDLKLDENNRLVGTDIEQTLKSYQSSLDSMKKSINPERAEELEKKFMELKRLHNELADEMTMWERSRFNLTNMY